MVRTCKHGCGYKSTKNHHVKRHEVSISCNYYKKGKNTSPRTISCPNACGKFFGRKDVAARHARMVCGKKKKVKKIDPYAPGGELSTIVIAKCFAKNCKFRTSVLKEMEDHAIEKHIDLFM
jgi:hypothetical protein